MKPIHHLVTGIVIVLLVCPILGFGQGYVEGANVSYEYIPMKMELPTGNQDFVGMNFKAGAAAPIFLKADKSKYLIFGANLEFFDFQGTHSAFEVDRVYSVSPTFGYNTMLSEKFNFTTLFIPTLNGDYKNVGVSDVKLAGIIRGSYKVSDNFSYRAILGYRQQFYGPQYIILLGLDWKVNDKWRVFGDMPSTATVSYALNQKANVGFHLSTQPSTYRLKNQDRYFEYNAVNPGLFAEYYIAPKWALRATVSYATTRDMEIYNKYDRTDGIIDFYEMSDRMGPINPEVTSDLSFKIGLSYRVIPRKG